MKINVYLADRVEATRRNLAGLLADDIRLAECPTSWLASPATWTPTDVENLSHVIKSLEMLKPFAYVNAFTAHVNVGFFRGAEIADPKGLLEGTGKFMRHVKLRPECDVDATALTSLIETAYNDMTRREAR